MKPCVAASLLLCGSMVSAFNVARTETRPPVPLKMAVHQDHWSPKKWERIKTVSSVTLAAALTALAWKRLPDWIKEDVAFREPEINDERLSSVIEKMQALAETGAAKLEKHVPYLHASILAFVQLSAQIKQNSPNTRNEQFRRSGRPCRRDDLDFVALREALDFANWAYYTNDKARLQGYLEAVDFSLIQNSVPKRPGYIGHYTAVSHKRKELLIGLRGTWSLEDLLTDFCSQAVQYDLRVSNEESNILTPDANLSIQACEGAHDNLLGAVVRTQRRKIRCHEGVLLATIRLIDKVQPIVHDHVLNGGYKLVLSGHSLGGGAASLLALLLRSRMPELKEGSIQVYAIASPPVVDHDTALFAAPFCLSLVNNSDVVPRASLANLSVFLQFLKSVSDKLVERGLNPTGVVSTTALLQKLAQGAESDDMLMTVEEMEGAIHAAQRKIKLRDPDHLYVPGQVVLMYEKWESSKSEKLDEEVFAANTVEPYANVLRFFELDGFRMISDHITDSYYDSIKELGETLT